MFIILTKWSLAGRRPQEIILLALQQRLLFLGVELIRNIYLNCNRSLCSVTVFQKSVRFGQNPLPQASPFPRCGLAIRNRAVYFLAQQRHLFVVPALKIHNTIKSYTVLQPLLVVPSSASAGKVQVQPAPELNTAFSPHHTAPALTLTSALALSASGTKLLSYTSLPPVWQNNPFVAHHCRFIPLHRPHLLLLSLLPMPWWWHNKSLNVYTL
ncbi:hypothetical protein B0H16DRAFT_1787673 [Mycena metata]|uniref:Uncharacterized protein n=1 Tax=Mycena metata TaxID=1033252 RepID=A0AAD7HME9_9AGAR|nr:hypothetical protein B0H16DRAFT_1787673 [Mycena metata]